MTGASSPGVVARGGAAFRTVLAGAAARAVPAMGGAAGVEARGREPIRILAMPEVVRLLVSLMLRLKLTSSDIGE